MAVPDSDYEGITTAKFNAYDADQSRIQGIINSPESKQAPPSQLLQAKALTQEAF